MARAIMMAMATKRCGASVWDHPRLDPSGSSGLRSGMTARL